MEGLQIHHDIHNNIMEIITKKEDTNKEICNKLTDYLKQFSDTENRGILRTILTTLKTVRKIEGFDNIYETYLELFYKLGGTLYINIEKETTKK
jgi:hypothetical protein